VERAVNPEARPRIMPNASREKVPALERVQQNWNRFAPGHETKQRFRADDDFGKSHLVLGRPIGAHSPSQGKVQVSVSARDPVRRKARKSVD
jgi:hypothetical protein